jgi:cbb3-type cytochrome oxidase maturation protein
MSLVSVLIPVTMLLVGFGLWAFFWAVRTGQFDDLDIPGWEILVDEQSDAGAAGASAADAAAAAADPEDPA